MWRNFDVGAVMECLSSGGASVAAGSDGLSRTVGRAHVALDPDHLWRSGANELVVTTIPTLLAVSDTADRLVARLDAARVSGVAVRLDTTEPLPTGILAAADKRSIPLITFPERTSPAEVTTAVLAGLLAAQRRRLEHVLDIHQRFTSVVLAGGGTQEIAGTLHELLGHPVAVIGVDGSPKVVAPADGRGRFDAAAPATLRYPIRAGEAAYGEIVAYTDDGPTDPDALVALERAALAVAVGLAQASALAEAEERFAAISLEELIAGHAGNTADVAERAASFGWDLTRPRAVLLASIDPPDDGIIPPAALGTIAAAARATLGPDSIVWTRSATIAALIAPDTTDPGDRRLMAETLRAELDLRLRSVNVSIGVGRRVDALDDLPRSFTEASKAVDVGRWARGRHVTEVFDDLGLERLLSATPTQDLADFVQHAIGALVDHDRVHNTDLVATLAAWLETRNMAEASRRLFVHYNTLKNRLDRIENIIGPVVTDAARALECEVAIYVDRQYDVPWGAKHDTES
jgi:purine catabolism regulator